MTIPTRVLFVATSTLEPRKEANVWNFCVFDFTLPFTGYSNYMYTTEARRFNYFVA